MIRSALFVSLTVMILIAFLLLDRLTFLAPQKKLLFAHCGVSIALYFSTLALNLFAATLTINRKLFLKDTGRKLWHFDNHLQSLNSTDRTSPREKVN